MSYTPMSDLGQQGLFDITRTLLQQPDLASLCEALSQLVKRSALADNAAIVLWQAQTQRASYYASREKDTPIKYEDETVLAHGPVRSILSRPDTLHCSYEEFCETWPQLAAGGLYPKFGHYCLMPLAAEGHIFGGCEFIRYDDRPWSEKEFNRLQTFTQIVSVVTERLLCCGKRRLNVRLITHRVKKTPPLNMKTKLFWHTVRYAAFCRALIRCIAVTKNFVKPGRSWPQVGYTQNLVTIA